MPKELFPKPSETLVNQSNPDDEIPFSNQTGDGPLIAGDTPDQQPTESPAKIHLLQDKIKALEAELNTKNLELDQAYEINKKVTNDRLALLKDAELLRKDIDAHQASFERANKTNEELVASVAHLKQQLASRQPEESMGQRCMLAILNGMAANGDFTVGSKLNSDSHISNAAKHASGVASFFANAAREARL